MKCCEKCFQDQLLVEWIRSEGAVDDCEYCGATGVHCIEAADLHEMFQGVVSLYEPIEYGTHFHKEFGPDACDIGNSLPRCFEEDGWEIFSEALSEDQQCNLLDDIRCLSSHHDSTDVESSELWTSQDRRLWHVSEEELWAEFCHHIKHERRFILKSDALRHISDPKDWLPAFLDSVEVDLPEGALLYRARVNTPVDRDKPYAADCMTPPPPDRATAGRANPAGIVVLYAAFEQKTAIGEMRPSVGTRITVATLRARRKLTLVDLASMPVIPSAFSPLPGGDWSLRELVARNQFLRCVNNALSKPVQKDEQDIEYVPTQYVTEVVKTTAYDGIIYGSSLVKKGHNVVLFDSSIVSIDSATEFVEITAVANEHRTVS